MKSAHDTSRNPDFSVLPRCCVLKCSDWSLGKIRQISDPTRTQRIKITTAATERNIRPIVETSHTGIAYQVERNPLGTPPHHGFSLLISVECACV